MKIKRGLAKGTYKIYNIMQEHGMLEDCHNAEEIATAIVPALSTMVDLSKCENYEEQLIYFVGKLMDGAVIEYALVKRVVGTQPYVTSSLEYDIEDVWEYMIIPSNEIETCDKVYRKSIIQSELVKLMDEYREEDYYADMMIAYYGM